MELQFTPGKYITLKETYEHAQHIVVDKNSVFKTNVYYEYYNELIKLVLINIHFISIYAELNFN